MNSHGLRVVAVCSLMLLGILSCSKKGAMDDQVLGQKTEKGVILATSPSDGKLQYIPEELFVDAFNSISTDWQATNAEFRTNLSGQLQVIVKVKSLSGQAAIVGWTLQKSTALPNNWLLSTGSCTHQCIAGGDCSGCTLTFEDCSGSCECSSSDKYSDPSMGYCQHVVSGGDVGENASDSPLRGFKTHEFIESLHSLSAEEKSFKVKNWD